MILSRRKFFAGAGALLMAPAIVRAASLMPISAPKIQWLIEWQYDGLGAPEVWKRYSGYEVLPFTAGGDVDLAGLSIWRGGILPAPRLVKFEGLEVRPDGTIGIKS